jgi:hypothetical protein
MESESEKAIDWTVVPFVQEELSGVLSVREVVGFFCCISCVRRWGSNPRPGTGIEEP